jgi:hypothetical protein
MPLREFVRLIEKDGIVDSEQTWRSWVRTLNHVINHLATGEYVTIAADSIDDTMIDWGTGTNQVNSADLPMVVTSLSAIHTLTGDEQGAVLCTGTFALTLPTAAVNLFYYITNVSTGTITLTPTAPATIEGDATFDLYQDENLGLVCDGTDWYIL